MCEPRSVAYSIELAWFCRQSGERAVGTQWAGLQRSAVAPCALCTSMFTGLTHLGW